MTFQYRESILINNSQKYQSLNLIDSPMVCVEATTGETLPQGRQAGWVYQCFPLAIGISYSYWSRLFYERKLIVWDTALDGFFIGFYPFYYETPITLNIYTQTETQTNEPGLTEVYDLLDRIDERMGMI